ncbi:MAG TPA: aminotransferase class I/II-fold pyridoxal phosphate-dependent enzyme [Pseudonocardiaceae bacterium]|nr:aminotransferase class I/II-fold pyridoxal phosphate-dependent enzyme [Pseudonocardiaceae bacterium]
MAVRQSATLAINERMAALKAEGRPVLHLAFGEAGLPVLPELRAVLADSLRHNGYGPVTGTPAAREAVAGYFARRALPTEPDRVLLAPGSKPLLYALLAVLPGDVVLPVPSWVSYAAQAALVGKRVVGVPIPAHTGGVPDPDLLPAALAAARADGARPGVLVLTLPDNPTGTVPPAETIAEICRIADREGLVIVSDEIYRDLARSPAAVRSPAEWLPDRTAVTCGLSKNLALGGYRIGAARLPEGPLGDDLLPDLVGVASEVWSCLASPMQDVAAVAFAEPPEIVARVVASRRLHGAVTRRVHEILVDAGASCRPPEGGFYLYPDFGGQVAGVGGSRELATLLLERFGVGVLAGVAFGDDEGALRFRIATSLLYGADDEQRLASLHSPEPLALPWIDDSLRQLAHAFGELSTVD